MVGWGPNDPRGARRGRGDVGVVASKVRGEAVLGALSGPRRSAAACTLRSAADRREDPRRYRGVDTGRGDPRHPGRGLIATRAAGTPETRSEEHVTVTGDWDRAGAGRFTGWALRNKVAAGDTTVLGATLTVARSCLFDELIITLGGAADAVRESVTLDGIDIVMTDDHATGCSSSLAPRCRRWIRAPTASS